MRDPPSGRVPKQGPDWFLVATEACGGGTPDLGYVLGVTVYIRGFGIGNKSGGPRGSHGARGRAQGVGRASLPRGFLEASLTCTPSLLDCFRSKNNSPEGFIPFDIPFLRNTKIGKKTVICTRPLVSRLVPKII